MDEDARKLIVEVRVKGIVVGTEAQKKRVVRELRKLVKRTLIENLDYWLQRV